MGFMAVATQTNATTKQQDIRIRLQMNYIYKRDSKEYSESELEELICSTIEQLMYDSENKDRVAIYVPYDWEEMKGILERRNMFMNILGLSECRVSHKIVTFSGGIIFVFTNGDFLKNELYRRNPLPVLKGYRFSQAYIFDRQKLNANVIFDIRNRIV